ncbi:MAG: acetylxylan esterase [Lentisphaeria bacterium]|nr:acetylxylan esterase [Lentisphaeria bacterium]
MKTEIRITPDRETCLYLKGETAVFTIEVRKNGKPAKEGKLRVSTAQDGGPGNTAVQTFDLTVSENPVKIPARMEKPCFCLCQAWYEGVYAERSVYYRIQAHVDEVLQLGLVPSGALKASLIAHPDDPPRPADFDAFWKETLAGARQLPEDMKLEKLPQYCRPDAVYYKFSMNSFNGDRVHGFLGVPAGKGPFPIIALFPGKGPAAVEPIDCGWTAAGCITVMFNVHKYPIPATPEESKRKMLEYARSHGVEDYWDVGKERPETFHFYSVLPGFCRVLDHVCREYPWDGRRLVLEGSSQGGWMVLCLGALYRERVSAVYAGVPSVGFSSKLQVKMKRKIPPYFEADYFAPKITAPILVSAGLRDASCQADVISAMFTLIGSRDKALETDAGVHMGSPLRYDRKRAFVLRALNIPSRPVRLPPQDNELTAVRGDMLHRYYLKKYQAVDRKRAARLAEVRSREDAEKYMAEIREKLQRIFGPMPEAKPIGPQVTGQISTEKLLIDKVLFQSRPGYYVSALFYRPKSAAKKLPGVLFLCGHSAEGKHSATYQRVPQSLALRGFGVLAVDPYGQGERREHGGGAAAEHNRFGQRLALLGEFFGTWRLHDALTALEYLKSRPEIDPARLGVTGCSGGGTMTSYVNAFSPDLIMAAPVCSMTRLTSNLENEIAADCEQNPPRFRAEGLDEDDLLLAQAPRPVMLGVQDNDFFDPRGTAKMYQSMQKFYRHFGKEDAVKYSLGKGDHSYSVFHQQEVGKFFAAVAGAEAAGTDEDIRLFEEKELFCTPEGSVWKLPGARSTAQILADLLKQRKDGPGKAYGNLPPELNAARIPVPAWRKGIHQFQAPLGIQVSRFIIETEPGIEVTLKKFGKDIEKRFPALETAVIFLPQNDGLREADLRDYHDNRQNFMILEVRGCGESRPCRPGSGLSGLFESLYPACGRMLGEEFLHGQVRDIIAVLKLLKKHGTREVTLIAEGAMCAPAEAAAGSSPVTVRLRLRDRVIGRKTFLLDPEAVLPPSHHLFEH